MQHSVEAICQALMAKVVACGVMTGFDDHDRASRIMREELRLLLVPCPDDTDKYANERVAVLGSCHVDNIVLTIVALECVQRIQAERKAARAA